MTVAAFFNQWLEEIESRGDKSPTTLANYRRNLDRLSAYVGSKPLVKLSASDLDATYTKMLKTGGKARGTYGKAVRPASVPLSPNTVNSAHRIVHACLEAARRKKLIGVNPVKDATAPKLRKPKARAFTDSEVERLIVAAFAAEERGRLYPGIDLVTLLLMTSGMRRSELLAIAWDAVSFETNTIHIRRTLVENYDHQPILRDVMKTEQSERSIIIPQAIIERLRQHKVRQAEQMMRWGREYMRKPCVLVFPGLAGHPLQPHRLTIVMRQIMRTAKVYGAPPVHGWRHSHATSLLVDGADIVTISKRLGHSKVTTTLNIYAHGDQERDIAASDLAGARLAKLVPTTS